jgi:two-component system, OmpR family, sensor kinase
VPSAHGCQDAGASVRRTRSGTSAASGTKRGIGLAVCRSIARAHGGDVRLFRVGARGLVAQVRLPLAYGARGGMKAA